MGKHDKLLSAGQTKSSERTLMLWDLRNFSHPIQEVSIDHASGLITPYYDADIDVAYMAGKVLFLLYIHFREMETLKCLK